MSLKEKIKATKDLKSESITIEEWDNVTIEIRAFSARKRLEMPKLAKDAQEGETSWFEFTGSLLVESCYDPETEEKIFEEGDIEWLGEKSGPVIDRLVQKCMEVNGISTESVKDAEKNLETAVS